MSWVIDLEELQSFSDEDIHKAKLVLEQEALLRAKNNAKSQNFAEIFNSNYKTGLCSDPELIEGLLYAYGAKQKLGKNNHICKFVSVNDKWAWESSYLIESSNRYADSESKLQTLAIVQVAEGDKVDVIESKATVMGHKARKIASYVVENGSLSRVKSREITLTSSLGY